MPLSAANARSAASRAKAPSPCCQATAANVAASSEADGFRSIPARASWNLSPDAAYVHITANETIHGVEFRELPDTGSVPLIADFSSSIASEPLDIRRFGAIYAGAQKNLGPVGIGVLIVDRQLLERAGQPRADIFDFRSQLKAESMLNTPPSWNWYMLGLTVKWMLDEGGVAEFAKRNTDVVAVSIDSIILDGNPVSFTSDLQRDAGAGRAGAGRFHARFRGQERLMTL